MVASVRPRINNVMAVINSYLSVCCCTGNTTPDGYGMLYISLPLRITGNLEVRDDDEIEQARL